MAFLPCNDKVMELLLSLGHVRLVRYRHDILGIVGLSLSSSVALVPYSHLTRRQAGLSLLLSAPKLLRAIRCDSSTDSGRLNSGKMAASNIEWPSLPLSESLKALVIKFYEVVDSRVEGAPRRLATEVFSPTGEIFVNRRKVIGTEGMCET